MAKKSTPNMFPVLLTVLIDMIGVGIVIPVLPPLIEDNVTGILPALMDEVHRTRIYGFLIAVFPFFQFFGAPVLGSLSDRFGRKPMLMISILGSMAGYFLFAYGILSSNIYMAFAGRAIDGFTGGNISIVFSSISDLSDPKTKTRNFGLIGMMFGLGVIIGPVIGGALSNSDLVSWFTPDIPFWFAGILCLFNAFLVLNLFKETLIEKSTSDISFFTGFRNLSKAFTYPNLRSLFTVVLLTTLGFSFFTTFFNVFMLKKFSYDEWDLGRMFLFIGICIAFTQGALIRPVSAKISPSLVLRICLIGLAVAFAVILFPPVSWMIYLILPFVAIFHGLSQPNLNTLVSSQASKSQQGEIMGINQSIASVGMTIPAIISGYIGGINENLPIIAASGFTFLGWMAFSLLPAFKDKKINK